MISIGSCIVLRRMLSASFALQIRHTHNQGMKNYTLGGAAWTSTQKTEHFKTKNLIPCSQFLCILMIIYLTGNKWPLMKLMPSSACVCFLFVNDCAYLTATFSKDGTTWVNILFSLNKMPWPFFHIPGAGLPLDISWGLTCTFIPSTIKICLSMHHSATRSLYENKVSLSTAQTAVAIKDQQPEIFTCWDQTGFSSRLNLQVREAQNE